MFNHDEEFLNEKVLKNKIFIGEIILFEFSNKNRTFKNPITFLQCQFPVFCSLNNIITQRVYYFLVLLQKLIKFNWSIL